jgi:hypothetical protein
MFPFCSSTVGRASFQAFTPPVGCREAAIVPSWSTARHSDVEGQETPVKGPRESTCPVSFHAVRPPVGSVDMKIAPRWSTATHSVSDGHETASIGCAVPRGAAVSTVTGLDQRSVAASAAFGSRAPISAATATATSCRFTALLRMEPAPPRSVRPRHQRPCAPARTRARG